MSKFFRSSYFKQVKKIGIARLGIVLLSFGTLPVLITLLESRDYGYWSVYFNIFSWLTLFEFGLGAAVKNRIDDNGSERKRDVAQQALFSVFFILCLIGLILGGVFILVFECQYFLGGSEFSLSYGSMIPVLALALALYLPLSLINNVFVGLGRSHLTVGMQFFVMLSFYIYLKIYEISHLKAGFAMLWFVYTSLLFLGYCALWARYITGGYRVSMRNIRFVSGVVRPYINFGGKMFVIQICSLVLMTSDRMLVATLLGPEYVAEYDIYYKYFAFILVVQSVFILPYWPAIAVAIKKKSKGELSENLLFQQKIFFMLSVGAVILYVMKDIFIQLWIGSDFVVDDVYAALMGLSFIMIAWGNVYSHFIAATEDVRVQLWVYLVAAVLNIPLSFVLCNILQFGAKGIVISTVLVVSLYGIVGPYDVRRSRRRLLGDI